MQQSLCCCSHQYFLSVESNFPDWIQLQFYLSASHCRYFNKLSISYAFLKGEVHEWNLNSIKLVIFFLPFPLFCFFVSALWCFGFWGLVCESQWLYLMSWFCACHQEQMFTKQWTGWIREVGIACCFNFPVMLWKVPDGNCCYINFVVE